MTWNDIVYGTGDAINASFTVIEMLGNNFNYMLIGLGFVLFFYWMGQMFKHKKEAKENGTIE